MITDSWYLAHVVKVIESSKIIELIIRLALYFFPLFNLFEGDFRVLS